ncbi:YesN/AraC family two-component response regulator [Paenibacillus sp. JGP012]|uniref:helix-turn-helix domain-containing protein n=1 Tax=Paenibacillus sp. JGP012 TaxID=2735914 RepID=UPI0016150732|nr:helix-turn-helix domain-containing protein [Paenibacillus sp. JGP012]MBB6023838.1 YesN/AraC family two-component response regulator [Paenibacillus sp. JGP012]
MKVNLKRSWHTKLIYSYFPLFLLTISILIFLSFLIVNELSRNETKKADMISTRYIVSTLERSLGDIEMRLLDDIGTNKMYSRFLEAKEGQLSSAFLYDAASGLGRMLDQQGTVQSIYLYRLADSRILTPRGMVNLEEFEDRAYIEQALKNRQNLGWNQPRSYKERSFDVPSQVISMNKWLPLPWGGEGLLVISIRVYALERQIDNMTDANLSFLQVKDSHNQLVYSAHQIASGDGNILNRVQSEKLGLNFESGIQTGHLYSWVSLVSYVWIGIGILTIAGAVAGLIYITRRNVRPIQLMMNRIQELQPRVQEEEAAPSVKDELALIDRALEHLIAQTVDYEKQHHENLLIHRRQLLVDLMEGERMDSFRQRLRHLLPLEERFLEPKSAAVLVAEMNGTDLPGNQNILKMALMNVFKELVQRENGLGAWAEWFGYRRLIIVVASDEKEGLSRELLIELSKQMHMWIAEHFRIRFTFGIGQTVSGWEDIVRSYASADAGLQHRLTLGQDAIVLSEQLPDQPELHSYKYLQMLADIVREFRLTGDEWRTQLDQMFIAFSEDQMNDKDIRMLVQSLIQMLAREFGELSERLQHQFEESTLARLRAQIQEADTLERIREILLEWLKEVYRNYVAVNETKSHRAMINELRVYIEEHFDDPDLSLKHLSDRFQISGKYASYLFKEEFDMKFVDFLVKLRVEKACRMLATSDTAIQDIAQQVGYANAISFGRVFKRVMNVTPGDYRKQFGRPEEK